MLGEGIIVRVARAGSDKLVPAGSGSARRDRSGVGLHYCMRMSRGGVLGRELWGGGGG